MSLVNYKSFFLLLILLSNLVWADEDEMAAMQRQLNQQVMEKPFTFESEQDIERYIESTLKSGKAPNFRPGKFWRQGYTCKDLRPLSRHEYANCLAYYRFYGRYW